MTKGLVWLPPDPYRDFITVMMQCHECMDEEETQVLPQFEKMERETFVCSGCRDYEDDYEDED